MLVSLCPQISPDTAEGYVGLEIVGGGHDGDYTGMIDLSSAIGEYTELTTAATDFRSVVFPDLDGTVAVVSAVNSVSPTSPNRTLTIKIGTTTYYIHAKTTND